ncbi:MAG: tRNA lysidine(34) synthetase TilS [Hyphomonadaceae bacterium]|nr:tRNA lysidine(34) synthetase TilS [Hyphomonadaceae bacterium]
MLDRLTIERMEAACEGAPILVALSGGGDSVALLHALAERFGPQRLRAGVVDHALRAGSAGDAQRARGFADTLGVSAEIVTLSWPSEGKRTQQAARMARHRALCALAAKLGARVVALGHTGDDQAETVLMRAAAGSGWRGLAGMAPLAPAPVWPEGRGLLLARPLLNTRRAALRDALQSRGAAWIEDPANENPAYERVRTRARLAALEQQGFYPLRLCALAAHLRGVAEEVDAGAAALIASAATLGLSIRIDRQRWAGAAVVRQRALQVLMLAASGEERGASSSAMAGIEARALGQHGFTRSGVAFVPGPGIVTLRRDPGAVLGRAGMPGLAPLALPPGEAVVWDGRLALTARAPGWTALPAENGELLAFSDGERRLRVSAALEFVHVRPLAAERVQHAFSANRK